MGKLVMGIIIALFLSASANAYWVDENRWVDEKVAIEFRDLNGDGVHDVGHVHIIAEEFDGVFCMGDEPAHKMKEYINRWYKLHSI